MKQKTFIFFLCIVATMPLWASSISSKRNQLNSAKENIQNTKKELNTTKQEKNQVQNEIQEVDNKINVIEDKVNVIEQKLEKKQQDIAKNQEELNIALKKEKKQYDATKERMVQMYKNKRGGYLKILFSSKSFTEAINRLEYIKRITKEDNRLIDVYKEQVTTIEQKKKIIEKEKKELDTLYKEQIAIKGELTNVRAQKDRALDRLAGQEEALQAQIKEMQQISNQLEEEIKRLTAQSSSSSNSPYTGGEFTWPVPGYYRISSDYNPRTSPISGRYEFHSGIDIPASYGTSVLAATDGVVIKSGWVNGYGNTIMIDHGGGIVTLYGHNSSLIATTGQQVTKGQAVARIGSTGYSTGNHCHFEVRRNGAHVNPWGYLRK